MPEMTQVEYAKHLGTSQPYVAKLVKTGRIPKSALVKVGKQFKIISEVADEALNRTVKTTIAPKEKDESYIQIRIESEKVKTRLKELEFQKKSGELILAEDVKKAAFDKARQVRDSILNVPSRVSALLAAESDETKILALLTAELKRALEELIK